MSPLLLAGQRSALLALGSRTRSDAADYQRTVRREHSSYPRFKRRRTAGLISSQAGRDVRMTGPNSGIAPRTARAQVLNDAERLWLQAESLAGIECRV